MKSLILFFLGLFTILSAFYLINPTELQLSSFNQVFAQSEDRTKNFDDAKTIHSSQTITSEKTRINIIQEKNFDDIIITYTSDTSTTEKSTDDNAKNMNFDEATLTQSSDTSTLANQDKGNVSFFGRSHPSEYTKIHPAITQILEHANPKAMAKIFGASIDNDHLFVYVHLADNQFQNKPLDIEILAQDKNIIASKLSFNQIKSLANLDSVQRITLPDFAVFDTHDVSEGVSFSMADTMHAAGFDGTGINIAVIDDSFITSNLEISGNIVSQWFASGCANIACNSTEGDSHGTAVAEIISDVAPNAELYLYTFSTELEFDDAAKYAAKNVDLIAMSAGWTNYPTDGSSSMTQTVEEIVKGGTPFVVSAGNYAETHWEDSLTDSDSNGWHEFKPGDEGLSFNVDQGRVSSKTPILVYLMWEESSSAVYDLDLSLIYDDTQEVVATSANVQLGKGDAFEYIYFTPPKSGIYSLGVSYEGSLPKITIEIFSPRDRIEYATAKGSVSVPTDAKGVISVGAINHNDAELEPFSSQGPTNNGITVPSLVGPDAVTTTSFGSAFYGTSAAAPHVAGIVALLLEKQPGIPPDKVLKLLQENADKDAVGLRTTYTNVYGYGKADANFLIEDIVAATEISIPDWVKNNAGWWADDMIGDSDFAQGIQYLISEGIMTIPETTQAETTGDPQGIPSWIKNNAGWWADGQITDNDFVKGIQYLVEQGIIRV